MNKKVQKSLKTLALLSVFAFLGGAMPATPHTLIGSYAKASSSNLVLPYRVDQVTMGMLLKSPVQEITLKSATGFLQVPKTNKFYRIYMVDKKGNTVGDITVNPDKRDTIVFSVRERAISQILTTYAIKSLEVTSQKVVDKSLRQGKFAADLTKLQKLITQKKTDEAYEFAGELGDKIVTTLNLE